MVLGGGLGGHDKHTRSTAADASFTSEAFTGPTFGSRTMGHHFVLALCVAYVLLLRVARAPCPIVDSWFQAFWTCDPFLLDAHFEVFAGSSSDPFAHFAASVGAISARSPLSWCRLPAALPRLRAAWLTLSRARSPLTPSLRAACFVLSRRLLVINFTSAPCTHELSWAVLKKHVPKTVATRGASDRRANPRLDQYMYSFQFRKNCSKPLWDALGDLCKNLP